MPGRRLIHALGRPVVMQPIVECAGGARDVGEPVEPEAHHPPVVLVRRIGDLRRRQAIRVPLAVRQRHPVARLRQVVADREHAEAVAEMAAEPAVVIAAPGCPLRRHEADRLAAGVAAGDAVKVEAVDEAARDVGLGEFLAEQRADVSHMRAERLVDPHLAGDQRVVQQVAAYLVGAVGEVAGHQQKPRRADSIAGNDDDIRLLDVAEPGPPVDIDRAGGAAAAIGLDALNARPGAQLDAGRQRLGPDRDRELAHRAAWAAADAAGAAIAGRAPVIVGGDDAGGHWPPVPAKAVEGIGQVPADGTQGQGRRRIIGSRRQARIAGQAAGADQAVDGVVVGRQVLVGNRPVRRQTVLGALAEIGRPKARPDRGVDVGRAADGVPHQDAGGRAFDRIIGRCLANVVVRAPAPVALPFPVGIMVRMGRRLRPLPLLEAHYLEPSLPQH